MTEQVILEIRLAEIRELYRLRFDRMAQAQHLWHHGVEGNLLPSEIHRAWRYGHAPRLKDAECRAMVIRHLHHLRNKRARWRALRGSPEGWRLAVWPC